jgi:hypothetical protein
MFLGFIKKLSFFVIIISVSSCTLKVNNKVPELKTVSEEVDGFMPAVISYYEMNIARSDVSTGSFYYYELVQLDDSFVNALEEAMPHESADPKPTFVKSVAVSAASGGTKGRFNANLYAKVPSDLSEITAYVDYYNLDLKRKWVDAPIVEDGKIYVNDVKYDVSFSSDKSSFTLTKEEAVTPVVIPDSASGVLPSSPPSL